MDALLIVLLLLAVIAFVVGFSIKFLFWIALILLVLALASYLFRGRRTRL